MDVHRFAVVGIVFPLLCLLGCREVSQPALDGTGPLFPVEQEDAWGYITRSGDLAIEPQFDRAYRFFEGRALVRENGAYGFIDTSGTFALPPTYAAAGPFSEGLAPVRPDSLWGFVDRNGTMVIAPQFAMTARGLVPDSDSTELNRSAQHAEAPRVAAPAAPPSYFSENYARVRRNGHWGYLDRRGNVAIPPQFAAAGDFRNGLARVRLRSGEVGYVTPTGVRVWPPTE
jgi:hypothetical protein